METILCFLFRLRGKRTAAEWIGYVLIGVGVAFTLFWGVYTGLSEAGFRTTMWIVIFGALLCLVSSMLERWANDCWRRQKGGFR